MWRLWWGSAYSGRKGRDREKAWKGGPWKRKCGWKAGGGENHGNKSSKRKKCSGEPTSGSQATHDYLGFSQFMDEDTGIEKVHLPSGARSSKSDKMKPKALHEEKPKDMSTRGI